MSPHEDMHARRSGGNMGWEVLGWMLLGVEGGAACNKVSQHRGGDMNMWSGIVKAEALMGGAVLFKGQVGVVMCG